MNSVIVVVHTRFSLDNQDFYFLKDPDATGRTNDMSLWMDGGKRSAFRLE
jgi:hypothetical protein